MVNFVNITKVHLMDFQTNNKKLLLYYCKETNNLEPYMDKVQEKKIMLI
jgi:hypothetical protein